MISNVMHPAVMNRDLGMPDNCDETANVVVMGMTANCRPEYLVIPVEQEINDLVSVPATSAVNKNAVGLIFLPLRYNDAVCIS
jgi:hypothetical protein